MLSRRTFRIFMILAFFSMAGIIATQAIWMHRAYQESEETFGRQVRIALQEVVRNIIEFNNSSVIPPNPVKQLSGNYFAVMVNDRIDPQVLDLFIQREFQKFQVLQPYAYSIYDCNSEQLIYGGYYKERFRQKAGEKYAFPEYKLDNYYFTVYFPSLSPGLIGGMGIWLYLSAVVILILIFFTYSLFVILRQKRLSEIQRDFINNMTHELRTPLTTIGISAEAIEKKAEESDPARIRVYAKIIRDEAGRLKQQLERMLGLEGGAKLSFTDMYADDLVKQIVERFVALGGIRPENIQVQLHSDATIRVDSFHFSQAINNLLDNAIKYGGNEVTIQVETGKLGNKFLLYISDNGPGIPLKYQLRVFERFFRVPYGDVHEVKGFGIGLYYVKQVITAHKGKVYLDNEVTSGCRFVIQLHAN